MGDWRPAHDRTGLAPFPQACFDNQDEDDADETVEILDYTAPAVFERLVELLISKRDLLSGSDLLNLTIAALGDRVSVNDGPEYIYAYARQQGYNIPPYPLAGCGEIKEFFADNGVKNVPEWYGKIGISRETYRVLNEKNLIVVRNAGNKRKAFVINSWSKISDKDALRLTTDILHFALADEEENKQDDTVF